MHKMKWKWLLSMGMAIVLITVLLTPTVALADNHKPPKIPKPPTFQTFTADGEDAYIAGYEQFWQMGRVQHITGEAVVCDYLSSDLSIIDGSQFYAVVDTTVVISPNGTLKGILYGDFTLFTADGRIEGNIRGTISGHWAGDLVTDVEDNGTFTSTKGSGSLAGVKLWGNWGANLTYDLGWETYVGPITIKGICH